MAMLFQNFNFMFDDPNHCLQIKQTLTIKPKDFYMRAILRNGLTATELEYRLSGTHRSGGLANAPAGSGSSSAVKNHKGSGKPMSIYYGSNSGTCESLAQWLASDAPAHGFFAKTVDSLDAANQNVPSEQPVIIITASYEGHPPDNAAHFVNWLENLKGKEMENMAFAVFGCGMFDALGSDANHF